MTCRGDSLCFVVASKAKDRFLLSNCMVRAGLIAYLYSQVWFSVT